jgi:hypothetical protein
MHVYGEPPCAEVAGVASYLAEVGYTPASVGGNGDAKLATG